LKPSIVVFILCGILQISCSTTTYLNLDKRSRYYIEKKLDVAKIDDHNGNEITLLLKDGREANGELLSVRDSAMILCTENSATEEELTKLSYPILLFPNNKIQRLTIEGSNLVLEGVIAGQLVGGLIGILVTTSSKESRGYKGLAVAAGMIGGGLPGMLVGGITGHELSKEEYILQDIPPDYNWLILKPLSRYPDEEPDYLKAIR
jgi:hypothetical protein